MTGFTLIESVMVTAVVSLIVIFTLGVIPTFKMSNRRANMELQAGALAQSNLEHLRTLPFGQVSSVVYPDTPIDGIVYRAVVKESELVTVGTPPQELSKKVRVEVSWTWGERPYTVFRETIFCKISRS